MPTVLTQENRDDWLAQLEARRLRVEAAQKLASANSIYNLTHSIKRSWYEDEWYETVVNWDAIVDLLDAASKGGWNHGPV